ncbi:hypothetical protein [Moheibacter sediminis]|uniref:Uncharacterized protein n=1 Tax=Moheibacter sediminis TaxID=1434700 RepID=A0A1W1ZA28_9FLAO|nr:hypothetical protein [Moheibacter sediminis]SMC45254.1 hypothetical protein SAMN06296427_102299 [Moheibacter sediminis]
MKNLTSLLFFSFYSIILSQEIPKSGKDLKDFVPINWRIIEQVEGDLNKDKKSDIVLIIEDTNPDNLFQNENLGSSIINTNPRYLLVLFKTEKGYDLKELNKTFVPTEGDMESTCLADPIMDGGIEIKNGSLVLSLNYWMSCGSWYASTNAYTFRFQKNEFELIGFDSQEFHRASGEMNSTSINFSTKKMSITSGGNMFGEDSEGNEVKSEEKVEWKSFKIDKLKNLKDLKAPLEWEFMGNFI